MSPPLGIAAVTMAVLALLAPSANAEERPPQVKRTISLTAPASSMAVVPISIAVSATPASGAGKLTAALQVRSRDGFRTLETTALDPRGRGSIQVVSNRAGDKEYRAVLLSEKGRVLAASSPASVTWTRLVHSVSLRCASGSAAVGIDVPCTIEISPPVRLGDAVASLQERGSTDWINLESFAVPKSGSIDTDVKGRSPGVGEYRVLLLRDARVIAESPVASISYG